MKKIIILLIVGLMVLTSCGKRGELLKTDDSIAIKKEKARADTAKRYWHASIDFVCEHRCVIGRIGLVAVIVVVGSVAAWNWGKWFGNANANGNSNKNKGFAIYALPPVRYLSFPDNELRMIIDTEIKGTTHLYVYSDMQRQAANDELVSRSRNGISLKIPDSLEWDFVRDYSGFTTEYLLSSFRGYDDSLKAVVEFILTCRGQGIPESLINRCKNCMKKILHLP